MELFRNVLVIFIGVSGGIAVGSGLVAFLTVLDVVPRLTQLTKSNKFLYLYESAVVIGAVFWTFTDFYKWNFHLFPLSTIIFGLFAGVFVGMIAAGLTEVLNVLPILAQRMNMSKYIIVLLMAMVLGKIIGSLFQWIVYRTL
ncbi:stage V sporulation protein AB [Chengkuizengella sediminis]|uniref:stage V sporulation protein AB n=1 Tax=Chengkuizengella sediminis TaxID=1885917 RepID=UPI001389C70D|nr:stage V sporulation protein AB [Chengkuizengella sediminis]NDI34291.1 stage V sporulation protein AB [Chengkuizengella sediminis]